MDFPGGQEFVDFGSDPLRGHLQRADHWLGEVYTDPATRESALDGCIKRIQLDVRRLAQADAFNEYLAR